MKRYVIAGCVAMAGLFAAPTEAAYIELASPGATTTVNNGVIFEVDTTPGGNGVAESFIEMNKAKDGTTRGYNAAFNDPYDAGGGQTRAIRLSEVSILNISGTNYYEFFLDLNETQSQDGANAFVSLTDVQLFVHSTAVAPGTTIGTGVLTTPIWQLTSTDLVFKDIFSGSGVADVVMYVPVSLFTGKLSTDFVTLWSIMGEDVGHPGFEDVDNGPEAWAIRKNASSPPPPGDVIPVPAAFPAGLALLSIVAMKRRRRNA